MHNFSFTSSLATSMTWTPTTPAQDRFFPLAANRQPIILELVLATYDVMSLFENILDFYQEAIALQDWLGVHIIRIGLHMIRYWMNIDLDFFHILVKSIETIGEINVQDMLQSTEIVWGGIIIGGRIEFDFSNCLVLGLVCLDTHCVSINDYNQLAGPQLRMCFIFLNKELLHIWTRFIMRRQIYLKRSIDNLISSTNLICRAIINKSEDHTLY